MLTEEPLQEHHVAQEDEKSGSNQKDKKMPVYRQLLL